MANDDYFQAVREILQKVSELKDRQQQIASLDPENSDLVAILGESGSSLVGEIDELLKLYGPIIKDRAEEAYLIFLRDEYERDVPLHVLDRKIDDLDLSVRSSNVMEKGNIVYIGELVQHTDKSLLAKEQFGKKSLNEVKSMLSEMDLRLGLNVTYERPENRQSPSQS